MTLAPGIRLSSYIIVGQIGAGGMGEVYRAHDERLGRDVAIKVLPEAFGADTERLHRFHQEARVLASLSHPNVVEVFEAGEYEGAPFLVMELLEGETLRERLNGKVLPPRRAAELARDVALGLAAAHGKGILHRDLKPENICLTKDGRVKVLDFGLAKRNVTTSGSRVETATVSEPGHVVGTSGYMSPEQVRGEVLDARSDLFSLGVVLWEMLAGRSPFHRDSAVETMHAILKDDPPEFDAGLRIPLALVRIMDSCLAKDPAARFHSAHDLAFGLEATILANASSENPLPKLALGRPSRQWLPALLSTALVTTLALLGWTLHRVRQFPPEYTYKRLTFHKGNIESARLAPDGNTVLYSAKGMDGSYDIYQARLDNLESRPLGLPVNAFLASVSSKGELAVRLGVGTQAHSMLSRVPLMGGTPREILAGVTWADWSPDGSELAVVHMVQGRFLVEYPIGQVRYESGNPLFALRVSPDGTRLAFNEADAAGEKIQVLGLNGSRRTFTFGPGILYGLAWTPEGNRLITSWGSSQKELGVCEISLSGKRRRLAQGPNGLYFYDCGPSGRLLVEHISWRQVSYLLQGSRTEAQDISWLEGCRVSGISQDGRTVILSDDGEGSGPHGGVWLRKEGSRDPLRLCDGVALGNPSPDGAWVPVISREASPRLSLVPTGPGQARTIPLEGIQPLRVEWHPKASRLVVVGLDPQTRKRGLFTVGLQEGDCKLLETIGDTFGDLIVRPDGSGVIRLDWDGTLSQTPLDGHAPGPLPAKVNPKDLIVGCSPDGRRLFLANQDQAPFRVDALDLVTGKRTVLRKIMGFGPDTMAYYRGFHMAAGGKAMAFSVTKVLTSDLYLMEPVK